MTSTILKTKKKILGKPKMNPDHYFDELAADFYRAVSTGFQDTLELAVMFHWVYKMRINTKSHEAAVLPQIQW